MLGEHSLILNGYFHDGNLQVTIESSICIFVINLWKTLQKPDQQAGIPVKLYLAKKPAEKKALMCLKPDSVLKYEEVQVEQLPWNVTMCEFPVLMLGVVTHCGLCAVLRKFVKILSDVAPNTGFAQLLGSNGACLKACAEVSFWTKMCELQMPSFVKEVVCKRDTIVGKHAINPMQVLDDHLRQPPTIHNISKKKKEALKKLNSLTNPVTSSPPETTDSLSHDVNLIHWDRLKALTAGDVDQVLKRVTNLNVTDDIPGLEHVFMEGVELTLVDVLLWPCVAVIFEFDATLEQTLPMLSAWYQRLRLMPSLVEVQNKLGLRTAKWVVPIDLNCDHSHPEHSNLTLCTTTSEHSHRMSDLEKIQLEDQRAELCDGTLDRLQNLGLVMCNMTRPEIGQSLPWTTYPRHVCPTQGHLPDKRAARKLHQLESVVHSILPLVKPGQVLVDFCAGAGHLGILLGYLRPSCKIVLVENKEESLNRAVDRIVKLNLTNVHVYQCNLDHFIGGFDLGTCLHGCGTATDLVLNKCLAWQASFVLCPCCYGAIRNKHTVEYPRSRKFTDSSVSYQDYLALAHSSDNQAIGKTYMNAVDSDRLWKANELQYDVTLTSLYPLNCSPKNNLLIGIHQ